MTSVLRQLNDALRVASHLGYRDIAAGALYKARRRLGLFPAQPGRAHHPTIDRAAPFFTGARESALPGFMRGGQDLDSEVAGLHAGVYRFFYGPEVSIGSPPNFRRHPQTGVADVNPRPWWGTSPVDTADVKWIWDLSRLHWLVSLARAYAQHGRREDLALADTWLHSWIQQNPPYAGPNWRCGQEASLRSLHLAGALALLGEIRDPSPNAQAFLRLHAIRIKHTLGYGLAQRNNHTVSEPSALLVIGALLREHWPGAIELEERGRRVLETQLRKLVLADGSFAMQSTNYNRSVLQVLLLLLSVEQSIHREFLPPEVRNAASSIGSFIRTLSHPATAVMPLLGPNDGSFPFKAWDGSFADTTGTLACLDHLLGPRETPSKSHTVSHHPHFGLVAIRQPRYQYFLRHSSPDSRPFETDAAHLDLWVDDLNLLIDSGTFSYRDEEALAYYVSAAAHNTVDFGPAAEPRRFGAFLPLSWPDPPVTQIAAQKQVLRESRGGLAHRRTCEPSVNELVVTDEGVAGDAGATIHWHLNPLLSWELRQGHVASSRLRIAFRDRGAGRDARLAHHRVSPSYGHEVRGPCAEFLLPPGPFSVRTTLQLVD